MFNNNSHWKTTRIIHICPFRYIAFNIKKFLSVTGIPKNENFKINKIVKDNLRNSNRTYFCKNYKTRLNSDYTIHLLLFITIIVIYAIINNQ